MDALSDSYKVHEYQRPATEPLGELATALAKAQKVMAGAEKEGKSNFGKYATLSSVWEACRGPLTDNDLCVIQLPGRTVDGLVTVTTVLLHASGQRIESTVGARPVKDDAQGLGSVITYLRRYALAAMVGVCPEDDDGEAAVGRGSSAPPKQVRKPVQPPPVAAPPPATSPIISERERIALEAAISECAKAKAMPPAAFRQEVKDKIGRQLGLEHFRELNPEQHTALMAWLAGETRKAKSELL